MTTMQLKLRILCAALIPFSLLACNGKSDGQQSLSDSIAVESSQEPIATEATKDSLSDGAIQRLKDFYEMYYQLMNSMDSADYADKAYQLIQKNCSPKFAASAIDEKRGGAGSDFVTYDYVDIMDLATLSISKVADHYEMAFDADVPKADGSSEMQNVKLAIYLEGGLINSVEEVVP